MKVEPVNFSIIEGTQKKVEPLLNPVDLMATTQLHTFDLISIHPAPLVRNVVATGSFYQLSDQAKTLLPTHMRFGVEELHRGR